MLLARLGLAEVAVAVVAAVVAFVAAFVAMAVAVVVLAGIDVDMALGLVAE